MWYNALKYSIATLSIFLLFPLFGCDNTLKPFERGRGLYSIYGILDLKKNVNYIRIKDLNKPLTEDRSDNLDATVTLENLAQHTIETLRDSVVAFEGVYTHNFRATMPITPATKYKVSVERKDGESIAVTVTTPYIADVNWGPTNQYCITPIEVIFQPVHPSSDLEISVGFDYNHVRYWANPEPIHIEDEKVTFRFSPISILNAVFSPPGPDDQLIRCFQMDNENLFVEYTHYGPDFGDIDFDDLNAPEGTIEFGGLYEDSFSFPIDTTRVCPPLC